MVVWVRDMAIVQKRLDGQNLYYLADATTGKPIAGGHLDFFGFGFDRRKLFSRPNKIINQVTKPLLEMSRFAEYTNSDGQATISRDRMPRNYQWLITARANSGRLAYMGFDRVWFGSSSRSTLISKKAYFLSDRPVYRPGQSVHYRFWAREARYDLGDVFDICGGEDPSAIE